MREEEVRYRIEAFARLHWYTTAARDLVVALTVQNIVAAAARKWARAMRALPLERVRLLEEADETLREGERFIEAWGAPVVASDPRIVAPGALGSPGFVPEGT